MSEELVVLGSQSSAEYKKSNNRLADNLRKMKKEYLQSLYHLSHNYTG